MKQMYSKEELIKLIQENSSKSYLHNCYVRGDNGVEEDPEIHTLDFFIISSKKEAYSFSELVDILDEYAIREPKTFLVMTSYSVNDNNYCPLRINEDTILCVENNHSQTTQEIEYYFTESGDVVTPL